MDEFCARQILHRRVCDDERDPYSLLFAMVSESPLGTPSSISDRHFLQYPGMGEAHSAYHFKRSLSVGLPQDRAWTQTEELEARGLE